MGLQFKGSILIQAIALTLTFGAIAHLDSSLNTASSQQAPTSRSHQTSFLTEK